MSATRDIAFDLLFNASVQIGLFALAAAAFSSFISKTKPKFQQIFYLAVLTLALFAPAVNTFRHAPARAAAAASLQPITTAPANQHGQLWIFAGGFSTHASIALPPVVKTALLSLWALLVLYQLTRFGRALYRVHRLRSRSPSVSPREIEVAQSILGGSRPVTVLQSDTIDDPVTTGIFRPAIVLPAKLLPRLDQQELTAIFAHEYGHIRRNDFALQLLCRLASLPVSWHPGVHYLMSRLSQTRELACDDYAALRLGKRLSYANTLIRLASLCLQVPRGSALELGIFDGDNLEDRINMLTGKKTMLSPARLAALVLSTIVLFGSGTMLAHALSLQEQPASAVDARSFVGTWHWMFQGHSFTTMILSPTSSGITGSVTGSKIKLDDDGNLSSADPSDDPSPAPITKTSVEGHALHVTVMDNNQPFEFLVTLKDATHAEIHPIGAPPNMKPIQAERVN